MSIEKPQDPAAPSPYKDYQEKQPEREKAMQESIYPKAEALSQKEIWDIQIDELTALRAEIREQNMGPSRLSRGELANTIDVLTVALQDRRSMLDGQAHEAFRNFKKEVENLRALATGAF